MPRLTLQISRLAYEDLDRIYAFLVNNNAEKQANTVMKKLLTAFDELLTTPNIGKNYPIQDENSEIMLQEWQVKFGRSGYSFLYAIEEETLVIITVKHYREKDYRL